MSFNNRIALSVIAIVGTVTPLMAQAGFATGLDDAGAPIPGIALAVAAGIIIGLRKAFKKK